MEPKIWCIEVLPWPRQDARLRKNPVAAGRERFLQGNWTRQDWTTIHDPVAAGIEPELNRDSRHPIQRSPINENTP
ncbi:MAG: hypothetical protein IJP77_07770 [Bacteroidales bacterium]|nr:hypothetical protein [Bacteroidales bacterium]